MAIILTLLGIVTVAELCVWLIPSLLFRRIIGCIVVAALLAVSTSLLATAINAAILLISIASLYRLINLMRVITARMHEKFLSRVSAQAGIWLVVSQLTILALWYLSSLTRMPIRQLWLVAALTVAAGTAILVASTIRHLRTTLAPKIVESNSEENDLPTLTVAIPARNETEDLEQCLSTLVASDYPKLEILV